MSFNNRPDKPVESQFYLRLVTEAPIRKESVKKFYNAVNQYSPEGVLSVYEVADPAGNATTTPLVHRVLEGGEHQYEIPLVRNLTANELQKVAENLNVIFNEGNFLLESSTFDDECCLYEDEDDDVYVEPEITEQLALKFAERMHDKWMHERLNNGWRYGRVRSDESKTHPLLQPWNQLAEQYKTVDYDAPQLFVDLLEEFGYTLISHEELNELIENASKKRK